MPNFRRVFIENSYVFVTIVINNRKRNLLTDHIAELRLSLIKVKQIYQFEIYAISIMPDHFHLILKPNNINQYPKIISQIKKVFTKQLPQNIRLILANEISASKQSKRESGVWQTSYYEHTIRNQVECNHLTDYIHYNPVKHGLVKKPSDWKFSSFEKFVRLGFYEETWCSFNESKDYG